MLLGFCASNWTLDKEEDISVFTTIIKKKKQVSLSSAVTTDNLSWLNSGQFVNKVLICSLAISLSVEQLLIRSVEKGIDQLLFVFSSVFKKVKTEYLCPKVIGLASQPYLASY